MFFDHLERIFKLSLLGALMLLAMAFFQKDRLPAPGFFDQTVLTQPLQTPTQSPSFKTQVNAQTYTVTPLFDYQLNGVVVTDYESGSFGDIYHHRRWKDFLNVKDLCVVWGENVRPDVFRKMAYDSEPWTCFIQPPDRQTAKQFKDDQLSNNHLLTDDIDLHRLIMSAAPGDQVMIKGMLANYENQANNFERGTSITRTDTGNGACETVYVTDFAIVKKANRFWRAVYRIALFLTVASALCFVVTLMVRPAKRPYG